MRQDEALRWQDQHPEIMQVQSSLDPGLVYGIKGSWRGNSERLFIAGAQGITELTRKQAVALFYELGDILVENLGVQL